MEKPQVMRVGDEHNKGLFIIIEGNDKSFVEAVIKKVITLLPKETTFKFDNNFDNSGEKVLKDTIALYQTVRAPIDAKTKSLLFVVAYSRRLDLIHQAVNAGHYAISTKSWLTDYRKLLELSELDTATQLFDTAKSIHVDVWAVLDKRTRFYRRLEQEKVLKVISHKQVDDAALKIYQMIQRRTAKVPTNKSTTLEKTVNKTSLPPKIQKAYKTIYDKLFENYLTAQEAYRSNALPLYFADDILPYLPNQKFDNFQQVSSALPVSYEPGLEGTSLLNYIPRNELDTVSQILFSESNASFESINKDLGLQSYDGKVKMLRSHLLESNTVQILSSYDFEIVCPFRVTSALRAQLPNVSLQLQPLSPLLGYDIPDHAASVELESLYQQSFDLSIELCSLLQAAELFEMLHLSMLGGHFVRLQTVFELNDIALLAADTQTKHLAEVLLANIAEVHPLTAETLTKRIEMKKPRKYSSADKTTP
jgi:hypothetical protein